MERYQQILSCELEKRTRKNPRYSLRAFASSLEVNPGYLSRILNGTRIPSVSLGKKIADHLGLARSEEDVFLQSLAETQTRNQVAGASVRDDLVENLEQDVWEVLAGLHHFAILELCETKNFKSDPRWIAKNLGLTVIEVKLAIARLQNLGLLKNEDGTLIPTKKNTTSKDKSRTSSALKRQQKEILERAIYSLYNDSLDLRSMTGMTMAIDTKKIPYAKKRIQQFMEELSYELGSKKECVYQLGVCLYPLQRE